MDSEDYKIFTKTGMFYIEKCSLGTVNHDFVPNSDVFNDFQQ